MTAGITVQPPTAAEPRARAGTHWGPLALFLAIGSFTPSFMFFMFFRTSSPAPGLMIAAVLLVVLVLMGIGRSPTMQDIANALAMVALWMILIMAHGAVAGLMHPPELARAALSGVAIAFMLLAAILNAPTLFGSDDEATGFATNVIRAVFVVIATASLLGIQPQTLDLEKPVFPFTEPSHYALAFAPLLIDGCVRARPVGRLLLLLTGFVIAYLLQSLSLLIVVAMTSAISLPIVRLGIIAAILAVVSLTLLDLTYFIERVSSDEGAQNISRLVYVQGWELIGGSLSDSWGWGVGFQQLGFAPIDSPTADLLFRLLGTDANLKDGGFTAAKIISEFGLFGIVGLIVLVTVIASGFFRLRRQATKPGELTGGEILAYSILVAYLTEIFVRGIGYFSGTTMLLFAACSYLWKTRKSRSGTGE